MYIINIIIGMTNSEAATAIYGHLMWKTNSFGKTVLLGKIEEKRRREPQRVYCWMALWILVQFSLFSYSVMSNSLRPHESQQARPHCPSKKLLEFTQTYVHRVSDVIQPSHPLLSPSPPAPNSSQHQSLFQWVNSSHEVAEVLEFQL